MALEGADAVLFQLKDKETKEDIDYENIQKESNENHVPMTTRREIISWYMFDFASQPIPGIALSFIFPIFLTTMATRYSCMNNTPYGCDWHDKAINSDYTLRVSMSGWNLKPASYASSMIAISSGLQAFIYLMFSSLADYGSYKIYLFRVTAVITQIMSIVWIFFSSPDLWLFAGWWGAVANVSFGLCMIFYNAYLLDLVDNHWRLKRLEKNNNNKFIELIEKNNDQINAEAGDDDTKQYEQTKKELMKTIQDDISQWGIACGFCGSNIVTIVCVVVMFFVDDTRVNFVEDIGMITDTKMDGMTMYGNYSYEYNIENVYTQTSEFYAQPVRNINLWYSVITIYHKDFNNISIALHQFSFIEGIQFIYDINSEIISGEMFGENESINMDLLYNENDAIVIDIESYYDTINLDKKDTHSFNVFTNLYFINAIQFNDNSNNIFGVVNNNTLKQTIENEENKNYVLAGYQVTTALISINFMNDMSIENIKVISGFNSIAFVDKNGQYGSTLGFQISYFVVGIWFAIFAFPAYFYLKNRSRPAIPTDSSVLTISITSYYQTFKKATTYPDLFRFLLTWFLFSDAISTTASTGILFGESELGMDGLQLVLLLLEVEIMSVLGAFFFVWLQKKLKWNAKQMLVMHLIWMASLPIYSLIGLIPGSTFGLVAIWEIYIFGFVYGFNQGSIMSLSRSLYARLIPIGYDSQLFGLYEITDKGSSWIGPLMVAFISNVTSMKWALVYIVIFYIFAIPLLYFGVDYERGIKQSKMKINQNDNTNNMNKKTQENIITAHNVTQTRSDSESNSNPENQTDFK